MSDEVKAPDLTDVRESAAMNDWCIVCGTLIYRDAAGVCGCKGRGFSNPAPVSVRAVLALVERLEFYGEVGHVTMTTLLEGWKSLAPLVGYSGTETDELYEIVEERLRAFGELRATIERQRKEIAGLRAKRDQLLADNAKLSERIASLSDDIGVLQKLTTPAAFGRMVLADILADVRDGSFFESEESVEWCELLQKFGYVEFVPYDPEEHGDIDAEPGQDVWIMTESMRREAELAAKGEPMRTDPMWCDECAHEHTGGEGTACLVIGCECPAPVEKIVLQGSEEPNAD